MRIMITGSGGQLGTELLRQIRGGESVLGTIPNEYADAELSFPEIDELNLCDEQAVKEHIAAFRPEIVLHCAAMTNVDGCEDVPEQAEQVNATAVKYIAQACEEIGAKLVIVSTDYVFAGDKCSPYLESDPCEPRSVYGRTKRMGEENAFKYCSRTFVVRTAWLYGFHGKNFVKTILKKAQTSGGLQVVNDQYGCPTNAEDLAYHMLLLAVTQDYGIYHCTGNGACSWYEFAKEIVRLAALPCEVKPCASSEYPQKATRPAYSVLDHAALRATVGDAMRPWKEALEDYMGRLEDAERA